MSKFKVGDKVKLNLSNKDFKELLKYNSQIEREMMLCRNARYMIITEAEDWGEPWGMQYSVDVDGGRTIWNENDLKLYNDGV